MCRKEKNLLFVLILYIDLVLLKVVSICQRLLSGKAQILNTAKIPLQYYSLSKPHGMPHF